MSLLPVFLPLILLASGFAQTPPEDETILENFNSKVLPGSNECGFQKDDSRDIVGGTDTYDGEFPWMAALEYRNKITQQKDGIRCGGFIITKRYIVTAAHCLKPHRPSHDLINIWLGVWKISVANSTNAVGIQTFTPDAEIPHPSYSAVTMLHDIGLVKLNKDITFTDKIVPLCLPKQDHFRPPFGTVLTVAGWGRTETSPGSDIKLKVDVPRTALQCGTSDFQICAGGQKGKDSCVGDSGGPLMKNFTNSANGKTQWYPQGAVNYGSTPCGISGFPGFYVRVSKFTNWILSNLK